MTTFDTPEAFTAECYRLNALEEQVIAERDRLAWQELDFMLGPLLTLVYENPDSLGQNGGDGRSLALQRIIQNFEELLPLSKFPAKNQKKNRTELSAWKRTTVMERDRYRCRHCGTHLNLTIDHIIAVANGGGNGLENLQTLCKSCNSSKGTK